MCFLYREKQPHNYLVTLGYVEIVVSAFLSQVFKRMHSSFKDILWGEDVDTDRLKGEAGSSKE